MFTGNPCFPSTCLKTVNYGEHGKKVTAGTNGDLKWNSNLRYCIIGTVRYRNSGDLTAACGLYLRSRKC